MYYKKSTGAILIRKYADIPDWVKWSHHSQGPNCCQECLMLDGCWFPLENAPTWPHHPHCHCTLDPIDYAVVLVNAAAYSDYSKFDPYLFNTHGQYTHKKKSSLPSGDIPSRMLIGYKQKWKDKQERNILPVITL